MTVMTMARGTGLWARLPVVSRPASHPVVRFAAVGGAATVLQLGLLAVLQVVVPVFWANVVAWGASTVVTNQVNRSLTFGVHGSEGARRDFWVSNAFSVVSLAVSALALAQFSSDDPVGALVVLIAANGAVGLARFYALRRWFAVHAA